MNRILRPTLSIRSFRNFAIVALTMLCSLGYSQTDNCPPKLANIIQGTVINGMPALCQADFQSAANVPVISTWFSEGATIFGSPMGQMPISTLQAGRTFNFGISQISIDTSANGMADCTIAVVVTEVPKISASLCDDVTIDLMGACSGEYVLPDEVSIAEGICDVMAEDIIYFSWSDMTNESTLIVNAHGGNPSFYSIYLRKFRDGSFLRQGNCSIQVTTSNPTVPVLACPSDQNVDVAPSCLYVYTYDVESASTIPCGGSIVMTQPGGGPSGTPLAMGAYTYAYELYDENGATVTTVMGAEPCSWTVTVAESMTVGAQMNCIGHVNVSIDGNCMATVDASTLLTGNLCTDISSLLISTTGFLPASSITFTEEHVGMEFDITVRDPNGINSCWGTVLVEDKLAPILICPIDVTLSCTMPTDTSATGVPTLMAGAVGNGGNETLQAATISNGFCEAELFFRDAVVNNLCNGAYQTIITRTFYAVDNAGNMSDPCVQTIYVEREDIDNASYPPHWDGLDTHVGLQDNMVTSNPPLACDGAGTAWAKDTMADGRVIPSPFDAGAVPGTGAPGDVGSCGTIFSFYEDIYIDICNDGCESNYASFKVLRTWDVFDWCTGEFRVHEQIIKVLDTVPPVFDTEVPDLTVSSDLWSCGATIYLPAVSATDQCSKDVSITWSVSGGTYDPVANTVHVPSVALTTPGNEILLFATAADCCGNLTIDTGLVTIIDNVAPNVIADEHTVVTLNNQTEDGATKVHADSFDDGSFDGCGPIDFWVRRMDKACVDYDGLDDAGNPDPSEIDEINDFHKYIHFCCDDTEEDQMIVFMVCDDADRDGTPEMNGDDNCNTAMILVDVQDKLAPTIVCPADKTINCIDFVIYEDLLGAELTDDQMEFLNAQFGNAYSNSTCGELGVQTFSGSDFCGEGTATRAFVVTSSTGSTSCTQTIAIVAGVQNVLTCDRISFPTLSNAPYNYDWCDPSDNVTPFVTPVVINECGAVNIESPVIDIDNLCTEVGMNLTLDTFNFAGGACMKILAHWEVIDQCLFEENFLDTDGNNEIDPFVNENGYYEIYVEYDIFDTEGPVMTCDDVTVATTDCIKNYDSYSISATDACTAPEIISYTYKVDIGNDGTFEYPADGSYAEGNSFSADSVGGLEIGEHAVKWVTYDGCGNYSTCLQVITVGKQIKAPTAYCHLGLSSAVMNEQYGCAVEFWATDFVVEGSDDCDANLTYMMIPYQDIYGDPADLEDDLSVEDALAMAMANWTFDCKYIENGESHVVELRIYTIDEDGRYDFCDASLTLNDNFDCCDDLDFGGETDISVSIQPDGNEGKDANIWSNGADSNYGDREEFNIYTWTNSGALGNKRGLIEFDLTSIPANAILSAATLTLYFNPTDANEGVDVQSGANDAVLERVTESWDEQVVTWTNQPAADPSTAISIPATTADDQDIVVSVLDAVQDMVSNADENFGFLLSMEDEDNPFRMLILSTSDHADSGLHPKLELTYSTPAPLSSLIAGNIATEDGMLVEDMDVNIMSDNPEFPRIQATNDAGSYMFTGLAYNANYELTASNNEGTKEGVSTLDLVLIQRHILGITTLDSPFKLIAADINNNEAISAADLLQLRKLILGIYDNDKLPNNNSWRFVDNAYQFVDATKPFPFTEMVKVNQLSQAMYNQNFVAVKVGDVNGTVSASKAGNAQVRSNENFEMLVNDQNYSANDLLEVEFTSQDLASLVGMQLSLEFSNSLSLSSVVEGAISLTEGNFTSDNNSLAISWNEMDLTSFAKDEVLFTLNFKANKKGQLSQALSVNDKVLRSEAYNSDLGVEGVKVNFRTIEDESFALMQNEPNPFKDETKISFILPGAGNATLKVFDITGKTIMSKSQSYDKGLNTVIINSKEMSASGVVYYQLTYGGNSATRKMILLD